MEKTGEQILGELLTEAQALVLKVAKQRDAWKEAAEAWETCAYDYRSSSFSEHDSRDLAIEADAKARALEEE